MTIHSLACRRLLAVATGASLLLSPPARAGEATQLASGSAAPQARTVVQDVALSNAGTLHGQVFNAQGHAMAATRIELSSAGRLIASTETSAAGTFAIDNLTGGVYQLSAGQHVGVYRLWPAGSQPPAARNALAVVSGEHIVRGQDKPGVMYWLTNPWIIAAGLGVAVIIPVAISNNNSSSS